MRTLQQQGWPHKARTCQGPRHWSLYLSQGSAMYLLLQRHAHWLGAVQLPREKLTPSISSGLYTPSRLQGFCSKATT
jgi:hypothetical protein